jgi:hypothetical protein
VQKPGTHPIGRVRNTKFYGVKLSAYKLEVFSSIIPGVEQIMTDRPSAQIREGQSIDGAVEETFQLCASSSPTKIFCLSPRRPAKSNGPEICLSQHLRFPRHIKSYTTPSKKKSFQKRVMQNLSRQLGDQKLSSTFGEHKNNFHSRQHN